MTLREQDNSDGVRSTLSISYHYYYFMMEQDEKVNRERNGGVEFQETHDLPAIGHVHCTPTKSRHKKLFIM